MRAYPKCYDKLGGVPGIKEVEFSITHNRGCFGACNFCSLAFHQGRAVTARSEKSVINEAKSFLDNPNFKGYISDVGGPTANFRYSSCDKQKTSGICPRKKCLAPTPCKNLKVSHTEYIKLLDEIKKLPGVKKVFIRSGIRFDYLMLDKDEGFFKKLVRDNVSGQLKVAPEHCSSAVLSCMGKPNFSVYEGFRKRFFELTKGMGKEQYLVPYLMSSHPGSTLKDALELALCLKRDGYSPEQVQDFYPTPGTASTVMFKTGIDPLTMKKVYVATDYHEKQLQRALLQYNRPQNAELVREALTRLGREDLIGYTKECLVRPANNGGAPKATANKKAPAHTSRDKGTARPTQKSAKTAQKSNAPSVERFERKKGWAKPAAKKNGNGAKKKR
jgi:uncharacterized radical SAM protein YgiQ